MTQEIKQKMTRQIIIDKGYEMIDMYGYDATSVESILSEVNLTQDAFYSHFENKHHFVEVVIQERIEKEIHGEYKEPIKKSRILNNMVLALIFSEVGLSEFINSKYASILALGL